MADFTSFLADMDQVAYVRSAELTEGDGRGCRIIDVFNGSGLAFTVAPDRGMNIVECSYRGIPVAFRSTLHRGSSARRSGCGTGRADF